MTGARDDGRSLDAIATLAEALTSEYDLVEFLHTLLRECLSMLDVQAAGLLLVSARGDLELVASTSESVAFVEVMQLNAGDGPCISCVRTGAVLSIPDVEVAGGDWTAFREASRQQGYRSAHAVPLRIRSQVIGSLGLFRERSGALQDADARAASTLANIASIGILHERVLRESAVVTEQLQRALDSRVLVEQAKGVLAAQWDLDVEQAFRLLRDHARSNRLTIQVVARGVVDRSLELAPS